MAPTEAVTVRKRVVVDAPIERAFTVFTERFGDFKPPEHNMLGAPIAETVFEPRVGGGIVDRAADGRECRWARILAFDPPERVVFSWDISPRWTIETDLAQTSEVEVRFFAESPTRTRVELEHRHIDRHGPGWEAVTAGMDGAGHEVGARCMTTRRIGGANRSSTSELVHIDPPRTWRVQGLDGPVRAAVDVLVEPVTDARSRLTITVDFTGHGIGKVLVPLMVRPEARKEMPDNMAALKQRLEAR